jgi:uncharacterized protein
MEEDPAYSSDVAFTPTVKAIQTRKGSRRGYARMEQRGSWDTDITPELSAFVERQISVFLGTAIGISLQANMSIAFRRSRGVRREIRWC